MLHNLYAILYTFLIYHIIQFSICAILFMLLHVSIVILLSVLLCLYLKGEIHIQVIFPGVGQLGCYFIFFNTLVVKWF